MKILKKIHEQIMHEQRAIPPETGGILGAKNNIISEFYIDEGIPTSIACRYLPDTVKINKVIEAWKAANIFFIGLYHTHFCDVETLSEGDMLYIKSIMANMPDCIDKLYFPLIVYPKSVIIPYCATIVSGNLSVEKDILEIIDY